MMKQNTSLISDLDIKGKECFDLKSKYENMKIQLDDRHSKGEDFSNQVKSLHSEVEKWKAKCE